MAIRFWRRVRIVPGLRVNLSRSGPSFSIGRRGAWYTVGPRGRRVTVGMPGSGLFLTQKLSPVPAAPQGRHTWVVLLVLAALIVAAAIMIAVA